MKDILLFCVTVFLLASCVRDKVEITDIQSSISPEFGVALAKATISAEDVIERYDNDGNIVTGDNEILTLVYRDSLEPISADEFLSLSEQSLDEEVMLPDDQQGANLPAGETLSFTATDIYELEFGDDRLDSIRFSTGELEITYTVPTGFSVSGSVQIIDPTNQSVLLQASLENQGAGSVTTIIDLQNQLIRFVTDQSQGITNGIRFNFEIDITATNDAILPSSVEVDFDLTDFSIRSIGGFISPRTFSIEEQSTDINLYESDFDGTIRLEDPRLNLFILSGFGIDVRPVLKRVVFYNEDVEVDSIVQNDITQLPIIEGANFVGDEVVTEVVISNDLFLTGTNLTDFLLFDQNNPRPPDSVSGNFDLDINPNANLSDHHFISQGAELSIEFELELPIYGSIAKFSFGDTTEIDFGDLVESANDFQELEQLDIRIFVRNALPIDAGVQMVFLDSNSVRIDSLFAEPTIVVPAAPVDLSVPVGSPNYGSVIGESEGRIDVSIPRERIDPLEDVTQVIITVIGNTTGNDGTPIRLFPENFIEVNLAAKGIFNIELE